MTSDVSVQTIVIVGCVCGALVVLLGIALAVVCCRRRQLMKKSKDKLNSVSTQSTSPVSSQSTDDMDVTKSPLPCGVMDPGFDNPSIDLSSFVPNATPQSDSRRKQAVNHNNLNAVGWPENDGLPLSVRWPHNGGNYVEQNANRTHTTCGDSGYTGASPHHRSTTQSPARSSTDTRASLRTDAHGRPVKKVIHEVIV